ncbi:MAG: hypothetical protein NVS3B3_09890 [Aquirhabdus sp.]
MYKKTSDIRHYMKRDLADLRVSNIAHLFNPAKFALFLVKACTKKEGNLALFMDHIDSSITLREGVY